MALCSLLPNPSTSFLPATSLPAVTSLTTVINPDRFLTIPAFWTLERVSIIPVCDPSLSYVQSRALPYYTGTLGTGASIYHSSLRPHFPKLT